MKAALVLLASFVPASIGLGAPPSPAPPAPLPAAPGAEAADDGIPKGTVAFFSSGACPANWAVASNVTGRLVVATVDGTKVGVAVGTPLANGEARTHQHGYATSVALKSKEISAGSGCCNKQGALVRSYPVTGTTGAAATNLPLVQLVVCEKP